MELNIIQSKRVDALAGKKRIAAARRKLQAAGNADAGTLEQQRDLFFAERDFEKDQSFSDTTTQVLWDTFIGKNI
jgi:hypothetical protein